MVVSAATQRLVSGLFVVEDRGAQPLKGIEQPVQLYRVVGAGVARRRTHAHAAARRTTPHLRPPLSLLGVAPARPAALSAPLQRGPAPLEPQLHRPPLAPQRARRMNNVPGLNA